MISAEQHEVLLLGSWRVAHRVLLVLANGTRVWMCNMHLHDGDELERHELRAKQMTKIVDWMQSREREAQVTILLGDFNAGPAEPAVAVLTKRGFTSAHFSAHGREPEWTFPTPLVASTKDSSMPKCDDYIFFKGACAVDTTAPNRGVRLIGNRPIPKCEPTLYPSDHLGVVADLVIG